MDTRKIFNISLIFLLVIGFQQNTMAQKNPDYVYQDSEVDSLPVFPGGKAEMMNHIQDGIKNVHICTLYHSQYLSSAW